MNEAKNIWGKATQKQIDYANAISEVCGLSEKFDIESSFYEVCNFINAHKEEYNRIIWRDDCLSENSKYIISKNIKNTGLSRKCYEYMEKKLYGKHGLYAFVDEKNNICYIGKSTNLADRIPSSFATRKKQACISKIMYFEDNNMANINVLELLLISEYNPALNTDCRTNYKSTMFHSGIDILKDFEELPFCFSSCRASRHD